MISAQDEEEFRGFEARVNDVMKILDLMSCGDEKKAETGMVLADRYLGEDKKHLEAIDEDNFLVKVNQNRTVINKTESPTVEGEQEKFAFMSFVEKDAARRAAERRERISIAQGLRTAGNTAFRSGHYEKAVSMYTKAVDQVKDSPILYNNRALTYIRLEMYKRAIIDCDFVLNKLDEKNLRAWLYRAKGYFMLHEQRNYEKSIAQAKKLNPKDLVYIEKVVADIEGRVGGVPLPEVKSEATVLSGTVNDEAADELTQ